jgi:hypothetical protein
MNYSEEQISAAYEKLPHEVKSALGTDARDEAWYQIMKEFQLNVDEARRIAEAARPVIYGLANPNEFPKNLRDQLLNLPPEKFDVLVKKVDTEVFAPIRSLVLQKMRESHEQRVPSTIYPQKQPSVPASMPPTNLPVQQNPAKPVGADFAQEKMSGAFRMPAESTRVIEEPLPPTQSAQKPPLQQKYSGGVDPYREPTK